MNLSPFLNLPAKGDLVMDNLAFLAFAADFWVFVSLLCWFLSFYLALEGRHLAYRRSLNQRVWLGAAIICVLKLIKALQELMLFSFESLNIPAISWLTHGCCALIVVLICFLTFPKMETAPRERRRLITGAFSMLALDFVFTMLATNYWGRGGLADAPFPLTQAVIGIGGQVVLSLGVLIFIAWQTQRLRIDQRSSRLLAEGFTLFVIVALTFLTCRFLYGEAVKEKNARDLELVQNAVMATPLPDVLQLRGVPADQDTASFRTVRASLARFRDINPSIENICLWTIRDGAFVVLADSSRRGPTPPGTVHEKAGARDQVIFSAPSPRVYGPFRAEWGSYVCVNDRVIDPTTGDTFCWMRIDLNTKDWLSTFASRRLLIMATAALLCLLVLVSNNYRLRTLDDIMVERAKQYAAEAERVRVGRDLHDDLGQLLSAINIQSNILVNEIDPSATAAERSRELCVLTQKAVVATQEIARGLVPEDGDFNITFRKFCLGIARSLSIQCTVDDRIEDVELRREVRVALMRVSQESINNAVKHGQATEIDFKLEIVGGALKLQITDNGTGFQRWERQAGLGTSVMRARIEELGGSFALESVSGSGVVVRCSVPGKRIGLA